MPTRIEWAEESWNPVTGCTKISEGCAHCYAERMARRLAGRFGYPLTPHHFDVTVHDHKLYEPTEWMHPRRVFVVSMGDLFHEDVPYSAWETIWRNMTLYAARHTYLLLTKRSEIMVKRMRDMVELTEEFTGNIWLGVTAENQGRAEERIPPLIRYSSSRNFVSCEPLLGPIDLTPWLFALGWVIVGGETGPGARPMDPDWARSIRDQCIEASVPFFFKRHGNDHDRLLDGRLWEQYPKLGT